MKTTYQAYENTFPIFKSKLESDGSIDLVEIIGTAFSIGNYFYLTASHVLANLDQEYDYGIGVPGSDKKWKSFKIGKIELNSNADVAIFECTYKTTKVFQWQSKYLNNLTDVVTSGYPHSFDNIAKQIYLRAFKGYIITKRYFDFKTSKNIVYELSFPCPKGISGSFLLDDNEGFICGLIIGNSKTSIEISYEKEELIEESKDYIYHKTETSSYGIAIASNSIIELKFEMLGNVSLNEYLLELNLIER